MQTRSLLVLVAAVLVLVLSAAIVIAGWEVAAAVTSLCGPQTGGCIVGGSR